MYGTGIRNLLESFDQMVNEDEDVILVGDSFDIELHEDFVIETGVVGFMEDGVVVQGDDAMFEFFDINNISTEEVEVLTENPNPGDFNQANASPLTLEEREALEEKNRLATLALIGALGAGGAASYKMDQEALSHSVQLPRLEAYLEYAKEKGDERMIDQLEKRIGDHKMRLKLGKGDVRDGHGEPIEVVYDKEGKAHAELDEAEYQGRKVTLNKPMKGDVKKSKVYVKNAKGNVVKVNFGDKNMKIKKNIPGRRKSFRARHNCDNPGPKWKARYWSCRAW